MRLTVGRALPHAQLEVTLILALINDEQAIHLSDRRITYLGGARPPEEADKGIVVSTPGMQVAIGRAGIASAGTFETHDWLLTALSRIVRPDRLLEQVIEQLEEDLNEVFENHPALKRLSPADKRLSLTISGYDDAADPPRSINVIISNFQDWDSDAPDFGEPWGDFRSSWAWEARPSSDGLVLIAQSGSASLEEPDIAMLKTLLEQRVPARHLIDKAVEIMREAADRPATAGTVGKTISSLVIPRDPSQPAEAGYHPENAAYEAHAPSAVVATPDGGVFAMKDITTGEKGPDRRPVAGPKLRRNEPCWCGSGKKYKRCHGA